MKTLHLLMAVLVLSMTSMGVHTSYQIPPPQTAVYNFTVQWNGGNYTIPVWAFNGIVTGAKLFPDGERIVFSIVPFGNGTVRAELPRDIFEHGPVGIADFADNPASSSERVGFDCRNVTVEKGFTQNTHHVAFDDSGTYYTGPGGPITHSLAGTSFASVRVGYWPHQWPVDLESEGRICGYSLDSSAEKLSIRVRPDTVPDFMQVNFQTGMLGRQVAVYADGQSLPFNYMLVDRQQEAVLNFTYPARVDNVTIASDSNGFADKTAYLPLTQARYGIPPFDTICPAGLKIIIRAQDGSAACVFPQYRERLEAAGWAATSPDAVQIYNPTAPQAGRYFEAGGIMFNVTGTGVDLSEANDTHKGGVRVVVNMTAQSLRQKPLSIDGSYFGLEAIAGDNKTVTVFEGADNYTLYRILPDHPSNITYVRSTSMSLARFESGWRYHLDIYLHPRGLHMWPEAVIPLDIPGTGRS